MCRKYEYMYSITVTHDISLVIGDCSFVLIDEPMDLIIPV